MKTALKAACAFLLSSVIFFIPVSAASSLLVQEQRRDVDQPGLQYECRYPHVAGISDPEAQQRLNVELRENAELFEKTAGAAFRGLDGSGGTVRGKYRYAIKKNSGGLFSMAVSEELYVGGRRGLVKRTGLTVDTVSGRRLALYDFFLRKADYRSVLSAQVKKEIARRKLRQIEPFRQIQWDEEFYVTDRAIVLMFRQYEYFPYECGIQEFPIPFRSLEGILTPEYSTWKTE